MLKETNGAKMQLVNLKKQMRVDKSDLNAKPVMWPIVTKMNQEMQELTDARSNVDNVSNQGETEEGNQQVSLVHTHTDQHPGLQNRLQRAQVLSGQQP